MQRHPWRTRVEPVEIVARTADVPWAERYAGSDSVASESDRPRLSAVGYRSPVAFDDHAALAWMRVHET